MSTVSPTMIDQFSGNQWVSFNQVLTWSSLLGRAKAAPRRKSVRPVPPKGRGKAPAAVQRQTSATRPEARGVVIGRVSEPTQPQRGLRKRTAGKQLPEGTAQKKRRLEEAAEEGTEEESASLNSGSDSASDPRFRVTQRDLAAESEDDSDDTSDLFGE